MNAETFNSLYPVGTPVLAYPDVRPEGRPDATRLVTRTRSVAQVLGGHTDVVWVDGYGSCIALTHVDVVSEDEWAKAQLADTVAEQGALPMPSGPLRVQALRVKPAEVTALSSEELAERIDFLERNALPELHRTIEHHQAGKQRWRERAEKAEAERDALQQRLHDAAMAKVWTNEDGKKFVFAEDIAPALYGLKPEGGGSR